MIKDKIDLILNGVSLNYLAKEREKLTRFYQNNNMGSLGALSSDHQRLAYIAARLPATYTSIYKVLKELIKRSGDDPLTSLLDIGAGPGASLLATYDIFPNLISATLLERDPGFIALGKRLTEDFEGIEQTWVCQDVTQQWKVSPHDLTIASYSLNELKEKDRFLVVEKMWESTGKFLVIIEPGTKAAYESLMKIRERLIAQGAFLVAPCPHTNACPLAKEDWCHFSVRVERSSLHRKTKEASLNYEDEKFSYLIFSKSPLPRCQSRILRRPFKGEGFVKLQLCSDSGLESKTITRKNKIEYARSKKLEWGDNIIKL